MKHKINITSMLVGAILGVVATLTIAAATSQTLPYGRFQLMGTANYMFKIDSSTGQVWKTSASNPSRQFLAHNIPESNGETSAAEK